MIQDGDKGRVLVNSVVNFRFRQAAVHLFTG